MTDGCYYLKNNGVVERVRYHYNSEGPNEQWNNIPSSQFLSVKEIAEHQLMTMQPIDKSYIVQLAKEDLITMHHGYGRWIRNMYGLWHPNNPSVIPNDLGDGHPDGLSMLVIEEIYKRLTTKSDAFQDAMSIVQEK